jgi:hypothetical protein
MKGRDEGLDVAEILARASDPEQFDAWRHRARATGWCANPVRLVGTSNRIDSSSGEVVGVFRSDELPDRVLLKACGHRRATICPTCSATYQADAYQLVAAGLRGGKGIPETIGEHPMLFLTLTAPSFGPVHAIRQRYGREVRCQSVRGTCLHGLLRRCDSAHRPDDQRLGQPICQACFDYRGAVIWNASVGELWRRTTIAVQRQLATRAGLSREQLREAVRISYAKVVEYQRRGLVHVHTVVRLDDAAGPGEIPDRRFDLTLLTDAVTAAIPGVRCPTPDSHLLPGPIRWGVQLDIHPISLDGAVPRSVAGYLAKYATKSTDPAGVLDHRLRAGDLDRLDQKLSPHMARMVRTAWELGALPQLEHLRLRAWAHTLGFRGHWLTKSRRYSTTFASLRAGRQQWHLDHGPVEQSPTDLTIGQWSYSGRGWASEGDAWLVRTAAEDSMIARRVARWELAGRGGSPDGRG